MIDNLSSKDLTLTAIIEQLFGYQQRFCTFFFFYDLFSTNLDISSLPYTQFVSAYACVVFVYTHTYSFIYAYKLSYYAKPWIMIIVV